MARLKRGIVRRLLRIVSLLGGIAALIAICGLGWAHLAIRRERPPLPDIAALRALADTDDRPVRLSWIETASQRGSRDGTGSGGGVQVVTHPAFVVEWADGRLLLVDTGMDAEAARAFGRPMEWLLGAAPVEVGRSVSEALGPARDRLAAVVFTHLHTDHTQGIALLCAPGAPASSVFMTPAQTERSNYTTRPGLAQVRAAPCARPVALPDDGLAPLPNLPGAAVVRLAGHTPGSQGVVVWIGKTTPRGYVLAGDVVFEMAQIRKDRPKPLLYRWLIVPEDDTQLGRVRRWLRTLETEHAFTVVPSHDQGHIEGLGLARFAIDR